MLRFYILYFYLQKILWWDCSNWNLNYLHNITWVFNVILYLLHKHIAFLIRYGYTSANKHHAVAISTALVIQKLSAQDTFLCESHSVIWLFVTLWTVSLPGWLLCPWKSPCKNTGVGSHSLLQGIFSTQGLNPDLLHCRQIVFTVWATKEPPHFHEWHEREYCYLLRDILKSEEFPSHFYNSLLAFISF